MNFFVMVRKNQKITHIILSACHDITNIVKYEFNIKLSFVMLDFLFVFNKSDSASMLKKRWKHQLEQLNDISTKELHNFQFYY